MEVGLLNFSILQWKEKKKVKSQGECDTKKKKPLGGIEKTKRKKKNSFHRRLVGDKKRNSMKRTVRN